MRRGSILFLKAVIMLTGVGVLAGMLWEPQVEGRNVNAERYDRKLWIGRRGESAAYLPS